MITPRVNSLKKMPQRGAARCSRTVAINSFSRVLRSHSALMVAPGGRPSGALLALLLLISLMCRAVWLSRNCGWRGLQHLVRLPEHLAVGLEHGDGAQAPALAGAARALPRLGRVDGAVGLAHDVALARLEKLAVRPVQFDGHVGAAVQVAVHPALVAHHEAGGRFAIG